MKRYTKDYGHEYRSSLFKNGCVHMNNVFVRKDIVHVRNIIDDLFERHSELSRVYATTHKQGEHEFYTNNIYEINRTTRLAKELVSTDVFLSCKMLARIIMRRNMYYSYDHAIYKEANTGSVIWHQDQAYKIRVKNMKSIHFWIPLHDISTLGGGMQYVCGSHNDQLYQHESCSSSHTLYVRDDIIRKDKVVKYNATIGDVIAHLPKTLHSSLPNNSDIVRKAWILHFSPYGQFEPFLPSNLGHYLISLVRGRLNGNG